MQKYDVFRLYVVKVSNHYLICSKSILNDDYIEVLTRTKIEVKDDSCVTSLTHYYTSLSVCNYSNGTHLMLSRDDILKKTIEINTNYAIMKYEEEMDKKIDNNSRIDDLEKKLDEAARDMFSGDGGWMSDEYRRPEYSLIGHLRDDIWLATKLKNYGLKDIFFGTLLNYVKTSLVFKSLRDAYEQRVVIWQINWMINRGDGWLVSDEFGGDFIRFDENCDIGFRMGILNTLEAIGVNTEAIEQGIEENADLWRNHEMESAFRNTYSPILGFTDIKFEDMEPVSEEHKNAWMKLRLYEYYQAHKTSVDKYGIVTPEMKMSEEEVQVLREYLAKMHEDRIAYLENLRNKVNSSGSSRALINTMNSTKN